MAASPLITLVDAFRAHTGKSEARIANLAGMGSAFFPRLRDGARCWPETDDKVRQWLSDNWPHDLDWPDGIPRPASTEQTSAA